MWSLCFAISTDEILYKQNEYIMEFAFMRIEIIKSKVTMLYLMLFGIHLVLNLFSSFLFITWCSLIENQFIYYVAPYVNIGLKQEYSNY